MNVLNKGIDLSDIGINNYAYSCDCIDDVLNELEKLHFTILGGDVYVVEEGKLILSYDNWYYTKTNTLSDCSLSISKARKYIEYYLEKNGRNFCVSFVFK